nr:transposase family protein [Microseira wollei]
MKKRHTFKNQLIVMPTGKEIVDVVVGKPGATSDIKIWRDGQSSVITRSFKGIKLMWGKQR